MIESEFQELKKMEAEIDMLGRLKCEIELMRSQRSIDKQRFLDLHCTHSYPDLSSAIDKYFVCKICNLQGLYDFDYIRRSGYLDG